MTEARRLLRPRGVLAIVDNDPRYTPTARGRCRIHECHAIGSQPTAGSCIGYLPSPMIVAHATSTWKATRGSLAAAAQVAGHPEPATGAFHPHEVHRAVRPAMVATSSHSLHASFLRLLHPPHDQQRSARAGGKASGTRCVCRWTDEYYSFDVEACLRAAGFDGVCTRASDPRHRVVLGLA